jgi:hypothetical protein
MWKKRKAAITKFSEKLMWLRLAIETCNKVIVTKTVWYGSKKRQNGETD